MTLKNSQPIRCGANVTSCWLSMKKPESPDEKSKWFVASTIIRENLEDFLHTNEKLASTQQL